MQMHNDNCGVSVFTAFCFYDSNLHLHSRFAKTINTNLRMAGDRVNERTAKTERHVFRIAITATTATGHCGRDSTDVAFDKGESFHEIQILVQSLMPSHFVQI